MLWQDLFCIFTLTKKLKVMKKLLKKGFDWEAKLEELVFEMVKDDEDEDSLKYAVKLLKEKLDSIFEDEE
jgi:hypothetical protein